MLHLKDEEKVSLGIPHYVYSASGGYNHFTLLKQYIWDKNKNAV